MREKLKCSENLKEKVPQSQAGPRQTEIRRHSKRCHNESSMSMPVKRNKPQVRCRHCRLTNHTESECFKKMGSTRSVETQSIKLKNA